MAFVLLASKGKGAITTVPVTMFFATLFFSYIGWYPIWTGTIIALVLALFVGWLLSRGFVGVT
jgi:hypothetical protein